MLTFDLSQTFGRVQITGSTRQAFLHRMSSNDVESLQAGQGCLTVLTNPIGRMIDATPVLAMDDALILLTGASNAGNVVAWLRKYVLYNDDVKVHDVSAPTQMVGVFGDGAAAWAKAFAPEAFAAIENAPVFSSTQTGKNLLAKAPPLHSAAPAGFYLIGANLPSSLSSHPSTLYESLRIATGYPIYPNEINADYIPLEAGLWHGVSFSKGCYIGQEIIARMESRNQIAKKLVQLANNAAVGPGAALFVDGNSVGAITSASAEYALGYVRTAFAFVGQMLHTQTNHALPIIKVIGAQQ